MSPSRMPFDDAAKAHMGTWLENWKRAGPVLEQERWDRLAAMSEVEAQQRTGALLQLWQPEWTGDQGEALLLHGRVFSRGRARR